MFCEEVDELCIVVGVGIKGVGPTRGMFAEKEDEDGRDEGELGLENRSAFGNLVVLGKTFFEMDSLPLGVKLLYPL